MFYPGWAVLGVDLTEVIPGVLHVQVQKDEVIGGDIHNHPVVGVDLDGTGRQETVSFVPGDHS